MSTFLSTLKATFFSAIDTTIYRPIWTTIIVTDDCSNIPTVDATINSTDCYPNVATVLSAFDRPFLSADKSPFEAALKAAARCAYKTAFFETVHTTFDATY